MYRYSIRTFLSLAAFFAISLLFTSSVEAGNTPSTVYPDPADSCVRYPEDGFACRNQELYLAVGTGEHSSGSTSIEIYAYSTRTVTLSLINGGFCSSTPPGGSRGADLGAAFTTNYQVLEKVSTATTGPLRASRNVGSTCATQTLTFSAVAGRNYELRATPVGSLSGSRENLYKVVVSGGNALLGTGTNAIGGISISAYQASYRQVSDHTLHFATACDYSSTQSIRVYDDDYLRYQSTGVYPNLEWYLSSRTRGSTGGYTTVASGISNGGQSANDYWGGRLSANREYRLYIRGLSRPNALEINLPDQISQRSIGITCEDPYACSISVPGGLTAGAYVNVSVRITNRSGTNWTTHGSGSTRPFQLGVVDRTQSYGTANGRQTAVPPTGIGPPDKWSATYSASATGSSTRTQYFTINGGSIYNVGRYGMAASINNGSSQTFTVRVRVPSTAGATAYYNVRLLDRYGLLGSQYLWENYVSGCSFNLTAPNPVPNATCTNPTVSGLRLIGGRYYYTPNQTFSISTRFRNSGTSTWYASNSSFRADMVAGSSQFSPENIDLNATRAPGASHTFTRTIRAENFTPSTNSGIARTITYQMNGPSGSFGQRCSITVYRAYHAAVCTAMTVVGLPSLSDGRYYAEPGQDFEVRLQTLNTGPQNLDDNYRYVHSRGSGGSAWPSQLGAQTLDATIEHNQRRISTHNVTAPNYASLSGPRDLTLRYQLRRGSSTGSPAVGSQCSIPIRVAERYDIQPPTGSLTGGTFTPGSSVQASIRARNEGDGSSYRGASIPVAQVAYRAVIRNGASSNNITQYLIKDGSNVSTDENVQFNSSTARIVPGRNLNYLFEEPIFEIDGAAPGIAVGEELCIQASYRNISGFEGGPSPTGQTPYVDIDCLVAADYPYFVVADGSVWAGGGFGPVGRASCAVPGGAADGFIRTAPRAAGNGAYSRYVAGATGLISNFSTQIGSIFRNSLIMANVSTSGQFANEGRCITDLTTYLENDVSDPRVNNFGSAELTSLEAGTLASGQYVYSGPSPLTLSSAIDFSANQDIVLITTGSVVIQSDITISGSYSNTDQIPSFALIAAGDINIEMANANDDTPDRLFGLYFANGTINTCNGVVPISSTVCSDQLIVDGAFAANAIEFRRTNGSIAGLNGSTDPAEIFQNYDVLQIANPAFVPASSAESDIVFLRDLPPVVRN